MHQVYYDNIQTEIKDFSKRKRSMDTTYAEDSNLMLHDTNLNWAEIV